MEMPSTIPPAAGSPGDSERPADLGQQDQSVRERVPVLFEPTTFPPPRPPKPSTTQRSTAFLRGAQRREPQWNTVDPGVHGAWWRVTAPGPPGGGVTEPDRLGSATKFERIAGGRNTNNLGRIFTPHALSVRSRMARPSLSPETSMRRPGGSLRMIPKPPRIRDGGCKPVRPER